MFVRLIRIKSRKETTCNSLRKLKLFTNAYHEIVKNKFVKLKIKEKKNKMKEKGWEEAHACAPTRSDTSTIAVSGLLCQNVKRGGCHFVHDPQVKATSWVGKLERVQIALPMCLSWHRLTGNKRNTLIMAATANAKEWG